MRKLLPLSLLAVAWACAGTPAPEVAADDLLPPEPPPASALPTNAPAATARDDGPVIEPTPKAPAASTAEPAASPAGTSHCPAGMVLVEGDYCTEVDQPCYRHWFDTSNKKKVCEEFAPASKCVGAKVKKRFCIDLYSFPNVKGERPEVMNTFYQAQVKCAALGKRMCTETEWSFACEGPHMKPYPYGYKRDARKCNGDHEWDHPNMKKVARRDPKELARLWRGVPSGSQPDCVSDFGVHDLPGNNDEVVSGESPKAKYNSVNTGGPWYKGVRNQCRPKIYTHDEGFYYYFLGFRCCAEPDNKPTDPRTPLQQRKNVNMSSVERLAGFGVERTKQALALKEKGECTCPATTPEAKKVLPRSRVLCNTLCGTTLGPGAKDGDDSTRLAPGKR